MSEAAPRATRMDVAWWQPVLFAALAGGMGWGIRGQYGHETGAMIAGLLVSLVLALLLCPKAPTLAAARAVAMATVAMGFGGTMTYGQTIGLTQNPEVIGNWEAWRWGMLGLTIKGGIWIAFAGAFFGMALSGVRYRMRDMAILMAGVLVAYYLGTWLLNSPHDPENRRLPAIYFSASWYWEPDARNLEPRPEAWGGLLFALLLVVVYAGSLRKDRLAHRMALWGFLGGIGFPIGQCLQSFHAWNPEAFQQGIWLRLDPHMNWWNMMETTFGAVMGAMLGLGLWLNRGLVQPAHVERTLPVPVEWGLLCVHLAMLVASELLVWPPAEALYDLGLIMGVIPLIALAGGRWWPYFIIFPVTLLTIAGKTVKELAYDNAVIGPVLGWTIYLVMPMAVASGLALWYARRDPDRPYDRDLASPALLYATWMYFLLNFAFFRFPWPWSDWTARTPNGIIFTLSAIGLTLLALRRMLPARYQPHKQSG